MTSCRNKIIFNLIELYRGLNALILVKLLIMVPGLLLVQQNSDVLPNPLSNKVYEQGSPPPNLKIFYPKLQLLKICTMIPNLAQHLNLMDFSVEYSDILYVSTEIIMTLDSPHPKLILETLN